MADPTPRYAYDLGSRRYRDAASGRYVAASAVRGAVDQLADGAGADAAFLAQRLQDGTLSVAQWQESMAALVKSAHVAASTAAAGGKAQMSPSHYGWVGSQVKKNYVWLRKFSDQIASGAQPLSGVPARAELYGLATRTTYRGMLARIARLGGEQQEKNILGASDHCDGCLAATAEGWADIGTLTPPGERECIVRCHCYLIYRAAQDAQSEAA